PGAPGRGEVERREAHGQRCPASGGGAHARRITGAAIADRQGRPRRRRGSAAAHAGQAGVRGRRGAREHPRRAGSGAGAPGLRARARRVQQGAVRTLAGPGSPADRAAESRGATIPAVKEAFMIPVLVRSLIASVAGIGSAAAVSGPASRVVLDQVVGEGYSHSTAPFATNEETKRA